MIRTVFEIIVWLNVIALLWAMLIWHSLMEENTGTTIIVLIIFILIATSVSSTRNKS